MPKLVKKRSQKAGLLPGTLVHVGEKKAEETKVTIIEYDETHFQEEAGLIPEGLFSKDKPSVTWINVDAIHQVEVLEKLGDRFGLHPLVMEDILNTDQRPKTEDMDAYIYIVLKTLEYDDKRSEIVAEQVSLVLGPNYVLSFREKEGDLFNPIRERIR